MLSLDSSHEAKHAFTVSVIEAGINSSCNDKIQYSGKHADAIVWQQMPLVKYSLWLALYYMSIGELAINT